MKHNNGCNLYCQSTNSKACYRMAMNCYTSCRPVCPAPCPPCPCCPPCPPAPDTFTVTYNPNGGIGGIVDSGLSAGDSYTIKTANEAGVSRPGYTFTGWNTQPDGSGVPYIPGQTITITSDLTLYAQWTAIPVETVTVTYNPNGGTGGSVDSGLVVGSSYTVKSAAGAGVSRPGYTFVAWNTEPDGSGTYYAPGDVITLTDDLTLYAQWELEAVTLYVVTVKQKSPLYGK